MATRRTTKAGLIVDEDASGERRITKTGLIIATAPEVETAGGVWPRFFSLILTFFVGG